MTKYNIISKSKAFAEDLSHQIAKLIPDTEVSTEYPDSLTKIIFIDEDINVVSDLAKNNKETPIVLFSSKIQTSDKVDLVIKKPFKLINFLENLATGTLLPRVRRKECIALNEYTLYPVKKEIVSQKTNKITKITEKEIDILKYLYQITPNSATKEDLLENVWGYSNEATTHTVETHIYRLRQKVEKNGETQIIITENNGYRLNT